MGFEPMASVLALQCSTNRAMKTHMLGADQFIELIFTFLIYFYFQFYVRVLQLSAIVVYLSANQFSNRPASQKSTRPACQIQTMPAGIMQSKKLSNLFELNSIKAELQYRSKVSYHCLVRPVSFLSRLVLFFICNLFRSFENVQICCHFGPPFAPVFPWFGIMGCDVSFAFALGISGTSLLHEYRIFRFLKIHKKIDFYPNQKIFCQKFIA